MSTLPQLRRSVVAAAGRQASSALPPEASEARNARRPGWRRTLLVSVAVVLGLAGVAFASGVIPFGSPAPTSPVQLFTAPRTGDGALTPGTVRMLAVSTSDPAGGAPWGMREFRTSRGLGCIEVARLADGRLVGVGQDHAFGNDGRYHALGVASGGAGYGDWCAPLDRYQRLFINGSWGEQPASAWQSRCYAPGATVAEQTRLGPSGREVVLPECPLRDERNLYFGLLGPDAEGVTYVLQGKRHTISTSGPEGAYLIVTRPTPGQLFKGIIGGGGVVPEYMPIIELHYRDGATCHLTSKSWIGEGHACTPSMHVPVGYVAPPDLSYTHAQVQTPLSVKLIRAPHGRYELRLSLRSRVALTNARSAYNFIWYVPGARFGNHGGYRTESDVAAGQSVATTTCPLPGGVIHGTVSLVEPNEVFKNKSEVVYAFKYEKVGVLVARFSVRIPGPPSALRPEAERSPSPLASCSGRVLRGARG